jgi:hypothetical protein
MIKLKTHALTATLAITCAAALPQAAFAATEAQKQAAIDSGLAWLASQQSANGSWCQSGYCAADTAAALLAFTEQKYKPLGWNDPGNPNKYAANVTNAINYILKGAGTVAISNDRGDGNNANISGSGVGYVWGGGEATYVTGLVLPALSRVTAGINGITPTTVISGTGNAAVDGKTYQQVIQDTVATFANGQTLAGTQYRGGWRYYPSQGLSDGSTAQWPAIGMLFAEQVPGVTVPGFVKSELTYWMDYIQCGNGGVGYDSPCGGGAPVSESKTGGMLVQAAFTGYDGYKPGDALGTNEALAYLNANWQNGASGWDGNFGQPYSMWSVYKGLESTIGLTNTTSITNLHPQGGALLDAGDTWNWYEDYSEYLVASQNMGDGSWPGFFYWPQDLATAWNINILNATQVGPPNPAPEPGTVVLFGLALAVLAASRGRKVR